MQPQHSELTLRLPFAVRRVFLLSLLPVLAAACFSVPPAVQHTQARIGRPAFSHSSGDLGKCNAVGSAPAPNLPERSQIPG